ncbi:TIR domain-containing protein [Microbacterium sp.]|uniref:TIR domain-containing protein n=1 Tax=Microbacterium sp. TaxID=51671 RepID=UPI003A9528F1
MSLAGFWSYVHKDDAAEGGRIAQLARDIVDQFEMITGDEVELFLDRDSLEWGAHWQSRIDDALSGVAFFVPILTPRYFSSSSCRSELNSFARSAADLGVRELLLPILYVDVPGADADSPDDELIELARSFQWSDFRQTSLLDRHEGAYRRAVRDLALRLASANREAERSPVARAAATRVAEQDTEAGFLDVLASFEEALPELTTITFAVAAEVETIGEVVTEAGNQLSSLTTGNSFARRLLVTRNLATTLASPAHAIGELGDQFATKLHDMDLGVRLIIDRAPREPEGSAQFCEFFAQIRSLAASADEGLGSLAQMGEQAGTLESSAREIRPVIREMRRGITSLAEGRGVMAEWVALIDASELECPEHA